MYFAASPFINLYNDNFQAFLRLIGQGDAPESDAAEAPSRPESSFDLVRRSAASLSRFESITEWSKSVLNNYWKFAGDLTRTAFQPIEYAALAGPQTQLMIENSPAVDTDGYTRADDQAEEAPADALYAAGDESVDEPVAESVDEPAGDAADEPVRPTGGRGRRK